MGLGPHPEARFVDLLEAEGLSVLRPDAMPNEEAAVQHSSDLHPSAAEYRWVAEQVAARIRLDLLQ